MSSRVWTEPMVTLFHELLTVRPLYRYDEIAARINDAFGTTITKNACIGFGRRCGVPPRNPRRQMPPRRSRAARSKIHLRPRQPPMPKPAPPKSIGKMMLWELETNDCRWPEGKDPPFLFCGAPKLDGCSYCIEHARRAFNPSWAARR